MTTRKYPGVQLSTIGSILMRWKLHHTTQMLCRRTCPPNQASKEDINVTEAATVHPEKSIKFSGWNWGAGVGVHNKSYP